MVGQLLGISSEQRHKLVAVYPPGRSLGQSMQHVRARGNRAAGRVEQSRAGILGMASLGRPGMSEPHVMGTLSHTLLVPHGAIC